jgi:hypothetical protein
MIEDDFWEKESKDWEDGILDNYYVDVQVKTLDTHDTPKC